MKTIREYGKEPFHICLLHGGPGAAGELEPVAKELSKSHGILEFLQTKKTINGQIEELRTQIIETVNLAVVLIGYSWGAWLGILFTRKYPELVKKLVLVGTPALNNKYSGELLTNRLRRLDSDQKKDFQKLLSIMESGMQDNSTLGKLGELTSVSDSYKYESNMNDEILPDINIYKSIWSEASDLRDNGILEDALESIHCPVIAIHGVDDPHPLSGVEEPLSERLSNFKMIKLQKCGHIPWKEKYAKENFFKMILKEISE
ncbi:MAG: alpha/beta hydrolase [Chitinophagales bacterium]|nr:alpha/beta hydrolase [Chitinophagales bacterium]